MNDRPWLSSQSCTQRPRLRELVKKSAPLVVPCAHDALSARLIERAGFRAAAMTGSGVLAARYALPDIGIVGLTDMAAAARDILAASSLSIIADGDDGYGDVKSIVRTVQTYETLGAGALVLEDQARRVKRPGQNTASAVVDDEEISAKLRTAVSTRSSSDFWIVGRTDAYGVRGIDAALRRAELYLNCGVDALFVAGLRSTEELDRVGSSFRGTPLIVVMYGGDDWPSVSPADLHAMGYSVVLYPLTLLLPMCTVLSDALQVLNQAAASGVAPPAIAYERLAREVLNDAVGVQSWMAVESVMDALPSAEQTKETLK